jgi:hypothetical protein
MLRNGRGEFWISYKYGPERWMVKVCGKEGEAILFGLN